MKKDILKVSLQWPSPQMNRDPFHVLLDIYSAHRMMDVQAWAVQLRITLRYIREGWTYQFQPLDLLIFGALKSATRRLFLQWIHDRSRDTVTKPEADQMLIWLWMHMQEDIFEESWTRGTNRLA
jgi:hypothetical protein